MSSLVLAKSSLATKFWFESGTAIVCATSMKSIRSIEASFAEPGQTPPLPTA